MEVPGHLLSCAGKTRAWVSGGLGVSLPDCVALGKSDSVSELDRPCLHKGAGRPDFYGALRRKRFYDL